ncbi:MAG: YbfB/YjiJ family MFS transporter, partial [Fimbriimonadaceae bacterium]|nr:YbfB/YjiJ family MFS transporter [Alphaproteobacteria bacterium]
RLIDAPQRNWSYAVINSGTSFGVVISGPLALFAGADWRVSWMIFAGAAAIATIWNAWILPGGSFQTDSQRILQPITRKWLFTARSTPLFVSALLFGIATSVIWTFAVDFLTLSGGLTEQSITLFWVLIGISGIAGGGAAQIVDRLGLRGALSGGLFAVILALFLLFLFPNHPYLICASAILFGSSFIMVTALYGMWSMLLFPERPSAGFGWTFFLISIGQFAGPLAGGVIALHFGTPTLFLIAIAICLLAMFARPEIHILSALKSHPVYAR